MSDVQADLLGLMIVVGIFLAVLLIEYLEALRPLPPCEYCSLSLALCLG